MGFFKKLRDLALANLNAMLDKAEDPAKLKAQTIIDLEDRKRKAREQLILVTAAKKRAETELKHLPQHVKQWAEDAERALTMNNEDQARQALKQKQALTKKIDLLGLEIAEAKQAIDTL